ncbi:MarR family winged helix-turn-helix transcriptional regulator [Thiolapillus brandeum]|uniref:MarR family transcriptional regulator n=1 Tax=Thiolapillus brandeum TaxID=1076588 RepID=A0A7U6GKA8_9GAMM|nr:MarR family transcriptional regulator [Thiolapillus brandeum]BAO45221.1 MarR family transcriptional regulator [Thiolapillus brandeum]
MVDLNNQDQARLNEALELLHFGFRAITSHPDERLAGLGYSRVHHRILYFVGRHPGSSINGLLEIMKVSKQYLHRPLKRLVDDGYVAMRTDSRDRRSKRLKLTAKGARLEASLTGEQRRQLAAAFGRAGPEAELGWRQVMALIAGERP